jgi:hypothetical protein
LKKKLLNGIKNITKRKQKTKHLKHVADHKKNKPTEPNIESPKNLDNIANKNAEEHLDSPHDAIQNDEESNNDDT